MYLFFLSYSEFKLVKNISYIYVHTNKLHILRRRFNVFLSKWITKHNIIHYITYNIILWMYTHNFKNKSYQLFLLSISDMYLDYYLSKGMNTVYTIHRECSAHLILKKYVGFDDLSLSVLLYKSTKYLLYNCMI